MYCIGIDLGTTGCKTVLFDGTGKVLCEYNEEYDLIFSGTFVEQDANKWWDLVQKGLRYVTDSTGVSDISGISVSTQSISFVPVDRNGDPLDNAVSWLDLRAGEECGELLARFGEKYINDVTGKPCLADYSLPKLIWYKNNRPEIYNSAWKLLFPLDFLNMKLCGRAVCDYSVAGGSMLYDIHKNRWDPELLRFSGIDEEKLPEVDCLGERVGKLLPDVAGQCGISPECTVYLGGQDQKLAAIGAGITEGACTVSFGTATAVSRFCGAEAPSDACLFRFDRNRYIAEIALMTTGAALRWLKRTFFESLSYKELDVLAEQSAPGAGGVTFSTDLSVGGTISGLTLSTTKADVIYALYEGVCRDIRDAVKSLGGADTMLVFGGGSKSDIWCRILARVSGCKVSVLSTAETGSLGAAILASGGTIPPAPVKHTFYPGL